MTINTIINGNCAAKLKPFPAAAVNLIFAGSPRDTRLQNVLYRPNTAKASGLGSANKSRNPGQKGSDVH